MTVLGSAFVEIHPELAKFAGELGKGVKEGVDKAEGASTSAFGKIKTAGAVAFTGIAAAAVGFAGTAVKAALDGQKAHAGLEAAVKSSGTAFKTVAGPIDELSTKFAKFGYENDAVETALARMVQTTGNAKESIGLMGVAANVAAARHIDLTQAAQLVGRAAEGQVGPLGRMGIHLKATGDAAKDGQAAIAQLNQRFGGAAAAQADTFSGKIAAMHAQFANMQEKVGNALLPVLAKLAAMIAGLVDWFERHKAVAIALGVVVGTVLVAAFTAWAISAATAAAATIAAAAPILLIVAAVAAVGVAIYELVTHWHQVWDEIKKVVGEAWGFIVDAVEAGVGAVVGFFTGLGGKILGALAGAGTWLLDIGGKIVSGLLDGMKLYFHVLEAFWIELPLKILGFLADAGVWLLEKGKDVVVGMFNGVKAAWLAEFHFYAELGLRIINAIGDAATWLVDTGKKVIGGLMSGAKNLFTSEVGFYANLGLRIIDAMKDAGSWLIDVGKKLVRGLIDGIKSAPGAIGDAIKGLIPTSIAGVHIPGLASGGIGHGLTLVGERGPELVNLNNPSGVFPTDQLAAALSGLSGGSSRPFAGGGDVNVAFQIDMTFNGPTSAREFEGYMRSTMQGEIASALQAVVARVQQKTGTA